MTATWAALALLLCAAAAEEKADGPASKSSVQQHFLGGGYKPYPGYYPGVVGGGLYPGGHGYPAVAGGYPAVAGGYPAVAGGYPAVAGGYPAVALPGYPSPHLAGGYPSQVAPGYYPGLGGGLPFVFYNADKDKKTTDKMPGGKE